MIVVKVTMATPKMSIKNERFTYYNQRHLPHFLNEVLHGAINSKGACCSVFAKSLFP